MLIVTLFTKISQLTIGAGDHSVAVAVQLFVPRPAVYQKGFHHIERRRIGIRVHDKIKGSVFQVRQTIKQIRSAVTAGHRRDGHFKTGRCRLAPGQPEVVQPDINPVTVSAFVFGSQSNRIRLCCCCYRQVRIAVNHFSQSGCDSFRCVRSHNGHLNTDTRDIQ